MTTHSEQLISLITFCVVVLTNFALLVKMHVKLQDLLVWQQRVDSHLVDTSRHLDPSRDDRRWDEVQRRLESLERKVDRVLTLETKRRDTDE